MCFQFSNSWWEHYKAPNPVCGKAVCFFKKGVTAEFWSWFLFLAALWSWAEPLESLHLSCKTHEVDTYMELSVVVCASLMSLWTLTGFPGGALVKNPPANTGDMGAIPGSKRSPGGGNGSPLQVFLPGKAGERRSLVGSSPWSSKNISESLGQFGIRVSGPVSSTSVIFSKVWQCSSESRFCWVFVVFLPHKPQN